MRHLIICISTTSGTLGRGLFIAHFVCNASTHNVLLLLQQKAAETENANKEIPDDRTRKGVEDYTVVCQRKGPWSYRWSQVPLKYWY